MDVDMSLSVDANEQLRLWEEAVLDVTWKTRGHMVTRPRNWLISESSRTQMMLGAQGEVDTLIMLDNTANDVEEVWERHIGPDTLHQLKHLAIVSTRTYSRRLPYTSLSRFPSLVTLWIDSREERISTETTAVRLDPQANPHLKILKVPGRLISHLYGTESLSHLEHLDLYDDDIDDCRDHIYAEDGGVAYCPRQAESRAMKRRETLSTMKHLHTLRLSNVTHSEFIAIGNLSQLIELKVRMARKIHQIPVTRLVHLRHLSIDTTFFGFRNSVPMTFLKLKNLESFRLVSELYMDLPDRFRNFKVKHLTLSIRDSEIPSSVFEMKGLESLTLVHANIRSLLGRLSGWPVEVHLEQLDMKGDVEDVLLDEGIRDRTELFNTLRDDIMIRMKYDLM